MLQYNTCCSKRRWQGRRRGAHAEVCTDKPFCANSYGVKVPSDCDRS